MVLGAIIRIFCSQYQIAQNKDTKELIVYAIIKWVRNLNFFQKLFRMHSNNQRIWFEVPEDIIKRFNRDPFKGKNASHATGFLGNLLKHYNECLLNIAVYFYIDCIKMHCYISGSVISGYTSSGQYYVDVTNILALESLLYNAVFLKFKLF